MPSALNVPTCSSYVTCPRTSTPGPAVVGPREASRRRRRGSAPCTPCGCHALRGSGRGGRRRRPRTRSRCRAGRSRVADPPAVRPARQRRACSSPTTRSTRAAVGAQTRGSTASALRPHEQGDGQPVEQRADVDDAAVDGPVGEHVVPVAVGQRDRVVGPAAEPVDGGGEPGGDDRDARRRRRRSGRR